MVIKSESRLSVLLPDNLSLDQSLANHRVPGYFTTPATPVLHSHSLSIVLLFVQHKHSGWLYVILWTFTDGLTCTRWPRDSPLCWKSVYRVMRSQRKKLGMFSLPRSSLNKHSHSVYSCQHIPTRCICSPVLQTPRLHSASVPLCLCFDLIRKWSKSPNVNRRIPDIHFTVSSRLSPALPYRLLSSAAAAAAASWIRARSK